jgi:hypothetical protein
MMQLKKTANVLLIAGALIAPAKFVAAEEVVPRVDIEHGRSDASHRPASADEAKARSKAETDIDKGEHEKSETSERAGHGLATATEHRNPHGEAGYQAALERREAARARHDAALARRDTAQERRETAQERRDAAQERHQAAVERRDAARERAENARAAHAPAR